MRSRWLAALAGLLLLSAATGAPATDNPLRSPLDRAVDGAVAGFIADGCHVGLSMVFSVDGVEHFYDYGTTDRRVAVLPSRDSVYELASVTKTFIGALAAKALADGRMTLDGDFRAALPRPYPNLQREGRPITLRMLATHTSGLQRDLPDSDDLMRDRDDEDFAARYVALNEGFTRARSLDVLRRVALRSTPGTRFEYSNVGIRVIGYGLETRAGMPLPSLLRRTILARLAMRDTTFEPGAEQRARRVTPYGRDGRVQPFHDASAGAAYGLYSTTRDMARYLHWQLNEHDPVVARAHEPIRGSIDDGEGLVWNIGRDGDERVLWHGGGSFGETSQMVIYPSARIGMVALANDACAATESELKAIALRVRQSLR